MGDKDMLHRLIDELPAEEMKAAQRFLEYLRDQGSDPLLRALMLAPEDDEPVTPEEEAAVEAAREELRRGEGRPLEDVRSDLIGE